MRLLPVILLLLCSSVDAVELRNVEIDRKDGRYFLHSEVWFDTDVESVYAVLLDYDLSVKFSSFIVEARNLEPDENGQRRFYIRNEGCVLFYCKSFERTGHVEHEPYNYIRSTADAELSDFHVSLESWTFEEEEDGTAMIYTFEFEPKFWVPPLIGPYVLQKKLKDNSIRALGRIEMLAKELRP